MLNDFSKENYKKACDMLTPSTTFTKEVMIMKPPKTRSHLKSRTFVALTCTLCLLFSVSIVSVAATNGEVIKKLIYFFDELTLDTKHSTEKEKVYLAEDGSKIHMVKDYGENGKYYVTLISMADTGRLHLKIGESEKDITEELDKNGVYTEKYTYNGETRILTVTGTSKNAVLHTESLTNP